MTLALLMGYQASAQNGFWLQGTVVDSAGNALPNFIVVVDPSGSTPGGSNAQVAFTNQQGFLDQLIYLDTGVVSSQNVLLTYQSCVNPANGITISLGAVMAFDTLTTAIISDCNSGNQPSCSSSFTYQAHNDTVVFSNTSSGGTQYYWSFGDSTTSTDANPIHIYSNPGFYHVCLTVTDSATGCTDTYCDFITVTTSGSGGCVASFSTQLNGLNAAFVNNQANFPPFFQGTSEWHFGDGSVGYGSIVNYTYAAPGTYNVCLIVSDTVSGCTDTTCQNITVNAIGGICAADFSYIAYQDTVSFNNLSTGSPSAGYYWDFGDGATSTDQSPTHIYSSFGTYTACLSIIDSVTNCLDTKCYVLTVGNSSLCQAGFFGLPVGGDSVQFVNISAGSPNPSQVSYLWTFGDGDSSTMENPLHQYPAPGTYLACLTVINNATGCISDTCINVTTASSPNACNAGFVQSDLGNGLIQFFDIAGASYSSEFWDFGDGNTSAQSNPLHQYSTSGPFVVTRVVTSVSGAGNVCSDTAASVIVVNTSNPTCFADFSGYHDTSGTIFFDAIQASPSSTYFWDLGDGTTATGPSISHSYAVAGSYNVCLVVSDSFGCTDTMCKVIPSIAPPVGFGVLGIVNASAIAPAIDFTAYLIVLDTVAGTLTAVDTFVSDPSFGPFFFFAAPNGDYRVKVALNPGDPNYANFLPTYYGDDPMWFNATVVNQNSFPLLNINMVPGTNSGGPGFIGGLISQGANRTTRNMVEGISVMLLDMNDNPLDYAMTNASGEFSFDNIAEGTYKVMVDMWGKTTEFYTIEIAQGQTRVEDINFEFNDISVWRTGVATYVNPELKGLAKVYPNPSSGLINVEMSLESSKDLRISLTNTLGQVVLDQTERFQAGKSVKNVNLTNFPKGIYQIAIFEGGKPLMSERILIK